MTQDEWLAAVAADRPPLTPAQIAALRPVCQHMAAHINGNAAPARPQEPRSESTDTEKETA